MAIGSGSSGVNKVTSFCLPSFLMIFLHVAPLQKEYTQIQYWVSYEHRRHVSPHEFSVYIPLVEGISFLLFPQS